MAVAEFLIVSFDRPDLFPPGGRVYLFRANDVVGGMVPWARALTSASAQGEPGPTRVTLTTPVPDVPASFPVRETFVVAAEVGGEVRTLRVTPHRAPEPEA